MQAFCYGEAIENVGWQYADTMLGEVVAVYAEQRAVEPNSLDLHALIIRPNGQSGYSELASFIPTPPEGQQPGHHTSLQNADDCQCFGRWSQHNQ